MSPFASHQYVILRYISLRWFRACIVALLTVISGCATTPGNRLYSDAQQYGFDTQTITTRSHDIVTFNNHHARQAKHLHVYLEGDGTPWIRGRVPAIDPSPNNPIALKLMALDTAPSMYVNRPCYGRRTVDKRCDNPSLWTSARYGQAVLDTLHDVLDDFKSTGTESFSLFGYSGGGNIAIQLAAKREDIRQIVTIAGNLDHVAWTQHFGYLPLSESINAVNLFPLKNTVARTHLIGEKDTVVPFQITMASAKKDTGARIITFQNFDHACCWENVWLEILRDLTQD